MEESYYALSKKLTEVVKKSPGRVVLQIKKPGGYIKYTYQDLYNNSQAIANSLIGLGIQKGDRVAIVLDNCPEWVFIYFGILFAGGIAVPLDPQSTVDDFKYFLENSEAKIVFTSLRFEKIICEAATAVTPSPKIVLLDEKAADKKSTQILLFSDFLKASNQPLADIKTLPDDIASILYTSGTTGRPKGVMLTHKNFYANFLSIEKLKVFDSTHNILSVLPLHHSFPFMATLIIPIFSQAKVTYVTTIKKEEILGCMQEVGITVFVGVPQFFYLFYQSILQGIKEIPFFIRLPLLGLINIQYKLRQLTSINLNKLLLAKIHKSFGKNLKYFVCGGARLDKEIEIFLNKIGFTLIQGYGLTETAPVVTFNPLSKVKVGSVGKAIPGVTIKIIKPDANGVGEIAICGNNVMKGYYKREKETAGALKDNWFYSGDLGYLDNAGYLFLTGRKKELIILGSGKNISPEEVETHYLQSHRIKELCVLAVGKNEEEKLAAVIVPDFEYFKKIGEIDIYSVIKLELEILSRDYPLYKSIMGFVITKEELPRTRLGKLKRHKIQNRYLTELMGAKPQIYKEEISEEDVEILSSPVYQTISTIIKKERWLEKPLHLSDHLGMELGFDSLSRVELISILEKQFKISISESSVAAISTVKDLVLTVSQLITEQKPMAAQDVVIQPQENLWQTILTTDPARTIVDKIAITPSWCAQFFYLLLCVGFYIVSKTLWRLNISGVENLPKDKPFILCPNHESYLDGFLVLAAIPNWLRRTIFFLGYHIYFNIPIIRNLIRMGRIIPLDPATNLVDAMRACSYVLRNNRTICIFPEGVRSPDGSLQPFKKGVGILAEEINVELVPVYIKGSFEALPRDKFLPNLNKIKITFGKPLSSSYLKEVGMKLGTRDDYEAITKGLEEEMKRLQG